MNKTIQPENLSYGSNGTPKYKIACCMLKEEISGKRGSNYDNDLKGGMPMKLKYEIKKIQEQTKSRTSWPG